MELKPFFPSQVIKELRISADLRWFGHKLSLSFQIHDPQGRLLIPPRKPGSGLRSEGLWKHTCLECFLTSKFFKPAYFELNISPSGDWAFYAFDSYRQGMRTVELSQAPRIVADPLTTSWHIEVDLLGVEGIEGVPLLAAASAVLELQSGELTYWADAHHQDKPDFHHPDHFVRDLAIEEKI